MLVAVRSSETMVHNYHITLIKLLNMKIKIIFINSMLSYIIIIIII